MLKTQDVIPSIPLQVYVQVSCDSSLQLLQFFGGFFSQKVHIVICCEHPIIQDAMYNKFSMNLISRNLHFSHLVFNFYPQRLHVPY